MLSLMSKTRLSATRWAVLFAQGGVYCSVHAMHLRQAFGVLQKRKLSYVQLGAVPTLLDLLHSPDAPLQLKCEVLDTLGSFSYSQPGLQALLDGGGLPVLQQALESGQFALQRAGIRALERLLAAPELQVSPVAHHANLALSVDLPAHLMSPGSCRIAKQHRQRT